MQSTEKKIAQTLTNIQTAKAYIKSAKKTLALLQRTKRAENKVKTLKEATKPKSFSLAPVE